MQFALLSCVAMLSTAVPARAMFLRSEFQIEPREVAVSYGHVCRHIFNEQQRKEYKNGVPALHDNETASGAELYCRSFQMRRYEDCVGKHNKLRMYLDIMPTLSRKLHKRSIMEKIYGGITELPRVIGAAATLWLKGLSSPSSGDDVLNNSIKLLNTLHEVVDQEFYNKLALPSGYSEREMQQVSQIVAQRPHTIRDVLKERSYEDRFYEYYDDELRAAKVLIKSISDYIKKGLLDTQALGELIGDEDLMAINPNDALLKEVKELADGKSILFVFDVVKHLSFFDRIIWVEWFGSLLAMLLCSILTLLAWMLKKNKTQQAPQIQHVPLSAYESRASEPVYSTGTARSAPAAQPQTAYNGSVQQQASLIQASPMPPPPLPDFSKYEASSTASRVD